MNRKEFDCMGVDITFNPSGNNPEDEVDGLAYTHEQVKKIKSALFIADYIENTTKDHLKEIVDDIKVKILNKLIEISETKESPLLFKEELVIIRDGVDKARDKDKIEFEGALKTVINSLVTRGDDNFEEVRKR